MSHLNSNFGIVAEYGNNDVVIFDTDNLTVLHTIALPANDYIDVAITPDNSRAVITSFNNATLIQLDLLKEPPVVIDTALDPPPSLPFEDIDITPDGRFALIADGGSTTAVRSYSLLNKTILSKLSSVANAVAVSPNGNGLVLVVETGDYKVRSFNIDNNGILTDTGVETNTGGLRPINITFSPDGKFAFVANRISNDVGILDTKIPSSISLLNNVSTNSEPGTIVVSSDGKKVYVLTRNTVDVFEFTSTFPFLTQVNSFNHGTSTTTKYGVDLMALNATEDKLFISHYTDLSAFDTNGTSLGTVSGVQPGDGGVAIRKTLFALIDSINFTSEIIDRGNIIQ
ncbi:beta-propeller fold lactonase family protein [Clostridium brassicae]|uniref:Beta-propeller fold lactonase family protein n=1 Tax=Clostridium brassicae TaxID=2999072 RepID=A0ABT4DDN0_9CLOT|nr:beta-propeller fold lactonase family protein [Clostridium brassicae]MCY6960420.1 beta-propeller fold lactonase family protein [Clostridium brassicae]